MPGAIILGVLGGMMGALFINVNTRMAYLRKRILVAKWMKPIETFMFCFVTASVFYWVPYFFNHCTNIESTDEVGQKDDMKYLAWCGQTDPTGTEIR